MASLVQTQEICKICGNQQFTLLRDTLRYDVKRRVLQCTHCGVVFLEDEQINLNEYYKSDYRARYSPVLGKKVDSEGIFSIYKGYQQDKLDRLAPVLGPDVRLLDVGSSAGQFLHAVAPHVKQAIGVELNEENARFAREVLGFEVHNMPVEDAPLADASFDVITSFQVLEHIDNPIPFLRTLHRLLKPGGYLCIEVPNIDDVLIKVFEVKAYTDFWYREVHVFNYSAETLALTLSKAGFAGNIHSVQEYNFLNHLNWIFTGKPQPNPEMGMSAPRLLEDSHPMAAVFNEWLRRADQEYKQILEAHGLGNHLHFLGQKKD